MKNIYDFDKAEVLMNDKCTKEEAKKHLNKGACIYTPEDFLKNYVCEFYNVDEALEEFGVSSLDDLLSACKSGNLSADCISSGIFYHEGKEIPYVITYCL